MCLGPTSKARFRSRATQRQAVAAVEFALLLPLLLTFLLGVWEVGRVVQINQILSNAAREGARKASTGVNTYADVNTTVSNYLQNAGVPDLSNLQVQVANLTQNNAGPNYDPSQANQLDQLQVTVSLPFSNVRWTTLSLITNSNTQLNAQATWRSNKNQSYPTSIGVPQGY
jgi:Flp pilus assembly protein TadG